MILQSECKYIFITGNSRSGTTMMSRILGNSEKVFAFHEIHFFGNIIGGGKEFEKISRESAIELFAILISAERDGVFKRRNPSKYLNEAHFFFSEIKEITFTNIEIYKLFLNYITGINQKKIPCEQTPYYVFYVEEILRYFPSARFINLIRDPRDILLSQKRRWKRRYLGAGYVPFRETIRTWINYHPVTISKLWNASLASSLRFNNETFLNIYFEDLIIQPEKTMHTVCRFLNITFQDKMLNIPVVGSSSESDIDVLSGIDKAKLSRWKNGGLNETEIWICQKITKYYIQSNGYQLTLCKPNIALLLFYCLIFPVKLFMAFILNLHRFKNLRSLVKRRIKLKS